MFTYDCHHCNETFWTKLFELLRCPDCGRWLVRRK